MILWEDLFLRQEQMNVVKLDAMKNQPSIPVSLARRNLKGNLYWPSKCVKGRYVCQGEEMFWHVTSALQLESIKEQGLTVTKSRFDGIGYPAGIYLFSSLDAANVFLTVQEDLEVDEYGPDAQEFVIIKVRPKSGTILFQDPFSNDASGLGRFSFYSTRGVDKTCLCMPKIHINPTIV